MKKANFKEFRVLDISTRHITKLDVTLMSKPDAPYLLVAIPLGKGSIFWVEQETPQAGIRKELRDFGFSSSFVDIVMEARSQKFDYIWFDENGSLATGLPGTDW